jgi:CRISPR type III-B/RAMP module RAMP protein Cmr6
VTDVRSWTTRPGRPELRKGVAGLSPTLLFHKWHAYDCEQTTNEPLLETKEWRVPFLDEVAARVQHGMSTYGGWHRRYREALEALGVSETETVLAGTTLWRLISGFATNPALENGLTLHPLHGFPYLPGSSVRGLVRHVAEHELAGEWADPPDPENLPEGAARETFLQKAEQLRAIFGSLVVENHDGANPGWTPPRKILALLKKGLPKEDHETRKRIDHLLNGQTGGLVTFYDAVPDPKHKVPDGKILRVDVLNPHYPDFFDTQGGSPPSDDQDPRPVYFLTLAPGVKLRFPFRVSDLPPAHREPRDDAERERREALASTTRAEIVEDVRRWLKAGLETWGAGGKTSAGYGYFRDIEAPDSREGLKQPESKQRA